MVELDGDPWFVAADVCRCLRLGLDKGTHTHTRRLDADEMRRVTPCQIRGLRGAGAVAVSESGLYKLIMRSDKPEARADLTELGSVWSAHPRQAGGAGVAGDTYHREW